MGEVLEGGIFRHALLGAEAVELLWAARCETVSLERCVGRGLFLELGEWVRACGAFGTGEEGHAGGVGGWYVGEVGGVVSQ